MFISLINQNHPIFDFSIGALLVLELILQYTLIPINENEVGALKKYI